MEAANDNEDMIEMVAHTHIEITFVEPLSAMEAFKLVSSCDAEGLDISMTNSQRIVLFETDEIEDVTTHLSDLGLIESIGMIKVISTFEPSFQHMRIDFYDES